MHFKTFVILPQGATLSTAYEWSTWLLTPFDEELQINPKWDWLEIGGRYNGDIQNNPQDITESDHVNIDIEARIKNNYALCRDLITNKIGCFSVLTPEGEFMDKGNVCDGTNMKDNDAWLEELMTIYRKYEDHLVIAWDLHI